MRERRGSIYIIKNTVNDKVYIGQTIKKVRKRFLAHLNDCRHGVDYNCKLYDAIRQLGEDKFYYEILRYDVPINEMDALEKFYIQKYDSVVNGYNGKNGGSGKIFSHGNGDELLLADARSGMNPKELAEKYCMVQSSIIRRLHTLGFYFNPDVAEILRLADEGKTEEEIAQLVGCHARTVSRNLIKNGRRRRRTLENLDIEAIKYDYEHQMPISGICLKYGLSITSLGRLRKEHGIKTRPQIYAHKIRYFD